MSDAETLLSEVVRAADSARQDRDAAERRVARAKAELADLGRVLTEAVRAVDEWVEIADDLRAGRHVELLRRVRRSHLPPGASGRPGEPPALATRLCDYLEARVREVVRRFPSDFQSAAEQFGLEIAPRSQHPRYGFLGGFIDVSVDDKNHRVTVAPRDGRVRKVVLNAEAVAREVASDVRRITGRPWNPGEFIDRLYAAYADELRAPNTRDTHGVEIRALVSRLESGDDQFRRDEFNHDLARLVREGWTVVDGKRLQLYHTRDRRIGLLLFGREVDGYQGYIDFKPEEPE